MARKNETSKQIRTMGGIGGGIYTFTLYGKPMVQKNSKQIVWAKRYPYERRPIIVDNPAVAKWRRDIVKQLKAQWSLDPIEDELAAIVLAYLAKRQRPDVDNLAAGPLDALEKAGIVKNDRQFSVCWIKRAKDYENPRIEIVICRPTDLWAAAQFYSDV